MAKTRTGWQNWSGSLPPSRAKLHTPKTMRELTALVKKTKSAVRPVGAGHSWMPLVPSDTAIISLDHFDKIGKIDPKNKRAWIGAGARLHALSPKLAKHGLGFRNLGDIDVQSLAGATSTATHGTGRELSALSAEICGLRLLTANGETLEISTEKNAKWLDGGRVALGALGILTEINMQLVERFKLHRRVWPAPHKEVIARADQLWRDNRNFEFFYIPFSQVSILIAHNLTDAATTPRAPDESDAAVMQIKALRDYIRWLPPLRKWLLKKAISSVAEEDVIGDSWDMLANERNVRFNEMEYHLPVKNGLEALEEVRHYIERERGDVFFPIEARRTRKDTGWLSPFQGADRISIAVHCYYKDAYDFLFSHIEPIFQRHGGRPHWGKLHSLSHAQARALYPDFEKFMRLRQELDPEGRFLNPYLKELFGA